MTRAATHQPPPDLLRAAADRWHLPAPSLDHVQAGGNAIYRAVAGGETVYLRLTEPTFRSVNENQAECDFLAHLARADVAVAAPIPSLRDRVVEPLETEAGFWSATLFQEAPGQQIQRGDALWTDEFVMAWGAALGCIHRAAVDFRPVSGWERGEWHDDYWLRHAETLLPADDARSRDELATVMAYLDDLPQTSDSYGMTHGDFGPQNFRYDLRHGITAFDFGNCGYHWFAWDVAVALTLVLWEEDAAKERFLTHLLTGYAREFRLDQTHLAHLDWFLRLRMLVVYLSRLWWFGPTPTPDQQRILDRIRANVHAPVSWLAVAAPTWRI